MAKAKKKKSPAKAQSTSAARTSKKPKPKSASGKKSAAKKSSGSAKKTAGKASSTASSSRAQKKSPAPALAKPTKPTNLKIEWDEFLTPLDDRLIVQISSGEKMTAGGLYIPDTVSDASGNLKGQVLVAGRGHRDEKGRMRPMDVHSGDTVLFSEFSGAKMNLLGQDVIILRESEILGIVDNK